LIALITLLVFLITFLVAGLAVLVGWLTLQRVEPSEPGLPGLFKEQSISTIGVWGSLLEQFDFVDMLRRHLDQADLRWSVGRFTLLMLLCGTVGFAVALHWAWGPVWVAFPCGAFTAAAPYFYVLKRRAARFRQFEEAFPDALDSLARALRAGHAFAAGMEILARESTPPVSSEMRKVAIEGNLGMSWDVALPNLSRRVPLLEVSMFVSAVQLQARTGGKLNEVLSSLAETMRESSALRGEVRVLAAHGKLTGLVLTLLPIVIAVAMLVVNPGYLAVLIQHPNGKYLIFTAACCLVAGHFVIRKLVDIRV